MEHSYGSIDEANEYFALYMPGKGCRITSIVRANTHNHNVSVDQTLLRKSSAPGKAVKTELNAKWTRGAI